MIRYCFVLDLIDYESLINEYVNHHKAVCPEILKSIKDSGIDNAEIYLVQNRLFMIIEADDSFSLEKKGDMDSSNETVQKWETIMWDYQKELPNSKPREKWKQMDCIF